MEVDRHTGIGLGIALKYLNEGDDVVLVGRSLDRLKSAIPEIFEAKGKALFLAQDVSTVCPRYSLRVIDGHIVMLNPLPERQ